MQMMRSPEQSEALPHVRPAPRPVNILEYLQAHEYTRANKKMLWQQIIIYTGAAFYEQEVLSFLLGLAIISAILGTIAHRELLMVTGSKRGVKITLELSVEKTSAKEDIRSNALTGRKLAFGDTVKEQKDAKISGSKTRTGAIHSVGRCGHGGGKDLSTNCYFRTRKPPKVYFDGHIPFTADYGRPRKHPPKNN